MSDPRPVCWVTGAGGLIGSHIVRAAPPGFRVVPLSRQQLDLADFVSVLDRFRHDRPDVVIHCAAISKAVECDRDPPLAWRINTELTRVLADLGDESRLVFISTDLVFDGAKGNYTEADAPNPLTLYARTKFAAEEPVLKYAQHLVIRTSLNGGSSPYGDRSFSEQLLTSWREGRAMKLFVDEYRSPIMAEVTARALWELVQRRVSGLYHLAGSERLSRYDIGMLLAARVPGLKPRIERASLREYPGPPRAPDTSLDSQRVQQLLSFPLPRFTTWLEQHGGSLRS